MTSIKENGGFVATPMPLAEEIVLSHLDLDHIDGPVRLLEPSAGTGNLIEAMIRWHPQARITAVEPNGHHRQEIPNHDEVRIMPCDFEAAWGRMVDDPNMRFDGCVMNPPFALPHKPTVWIDHVDAAMDLMNVGGVLVAIVPAGFMFRTDKKHRYIRERMDKWDVQAYPLEPGAFEGTNVRTCVLVATKPGEDVVEPAKPSWKQMSREEKIAAKKARMAADRKLRQAADLALEDEEFSTELEQVVHRIPADAKLRTYSPRNQALVLIQAASQGITLTGDLRTFAAWRREGRAIVKGSQALRIVAPMGDWADKQSSGQPANEGPAAAGVPTAARGAPSGPAESDGDDGQSTPRFTMQTVFDSAQTQEVGS
ncbi:putative RNA methylase [Prauserella sediminis]|uniref:Putative RNA methylase n=1 Tax=Prauserella sediminis TaxID=577680 RepID=A0A839XY01_9PSEU|nr:class I SAM-dependent methyltransferase [Prauserella sediminis]MBB3665938.1 putative RNA methylase [Prauserella sediminis]